MARRAHVLTPMGFGAMPDTIAIVQATSHQVYASDADASGHREFDRWQVTECRVTPRGATRGATVMGRERSTLWEYLTRMIMDCSRPWLMSVSAREVMAISGLWDLMLENRASLSGVDPYNDDDDRGENKRPTDGYVILEGPPTVARFKLAGIETPITWVDPANYGAADLWDKLCEQYKASFPDVAQLPESWAVSPKLPDLVNATVAWLTSYIAMLNNLQLGALEHTAATQAMCGYRRSYMREPIVIHDNELALALERDSLFGGRCECRFVGTIVSSDLFIKSPVVRGDDVAIGNGMGKIHRLDVNAMYPFVAQNACLPARLECVCRHVPLETLTAAVKAVPVIAHVLIETEVPIVPVKIDDQHSHTGPLGDRTFGAITSEEDDCVIYPVGRYWTTLCGPELALAIEDGRILKCSVLAAYNGRPIYSRWVNDLYKARRMAALSGDTTQADCIKGLLNASFGKWAQRRKRWVDIKDGNCPFPFYQWSEPYGKRGTLTSFRSLCWNTAVLTDAGEPNESFPAIASYIASLGRAYLWRLISRAGSANVYYYDTDSLWVNEEGLEQLADLLDTDGPNIGMLKEEGCYDKVRFYGPKRYEADGVLTIAGCPSRKCDSSDCFALHYKAPPIGHYLSVKQPPGTDRIIAKNRFNLPYTLGSVQSDGRVKPFRLEDDPAACHRF